MRGLDKSPNGSAFYTFVSIMNSVCSVTANQDLENDFDNNHKYIINIINDIRHVSSNVLNYRGIVTNENVNLIIKTFIKHYKTNWYNFYQRRFFIYKNRSKLNDTLVDLFDKDPVITDFILRNITKTLFL